MNTGTNIGSLHVHPLPSLPSSPPLPAGRLTSSFYPLPTGGSGARGDTEPKFSLPPPPHTGSPSQVPQASTPASDKEPGVNVTEVGEGEGRGFNVNIPWKEGGATDADYQVRRTGRGAGEEAGGKGATDSFWGPHCLLGLSMWEVGGPTTAFLPCS